jgi:glutathione reductase (NADPH)
MPTFDYDLFVIGAGSGGVRASRMAASFGARVAIAESHRAGGTCVIRGCVPKKLLVYAAHYHEEFQDAHGFGWDVPLPFFSWSRLMAAKDREIARLEGIYERMLQAAGVHLFKGSARVVDPHTVLVDGQRYTAKFILIATGGRPTKPAITGADLAITSNEAFELKDLPQRDLLVGGGDIAVEFAGIFHGLGAQVTLMHRGEDILRGFDDDVRRHLREALTAKGIKVLLGQEISEIRQDTGGMVAVATGDSPNINCDAVMFATGRMPQTASLMLERVGVELDELGAVKVDAYSRTSVDSIYAVGDVTNRIQLTPMAIREGAAVASTLFNHQPTRVDHYNVPSAVFSQPPIGTVGDSETQAIRKYGQIEVYQSRFRPLKSTLSGRDEMVYLKLLVEPGSQKVVGAHMVGADAPEIIQGIAIAVVAGLTKQQFDATLGIHPSAAEEFVTLRNMEIRRAPGYAFGQN